MEGKNLSDNFFRKSFFFASNNDYCLVFEWENLK